MKFPLILKSTLSLIFVGVIAIIGFRALNETDSKLISFSFAALLVTSVSFIIIYHRTRYQMFYLEGSLDAMEQPVTTTDMKMKWRFINKTTETLLAQQNLNKRNVRGKHCSSWQADICGTENCGVECLRANKPRTHYNQNIPGGSSIYMQVDTNYIHDDMGRKIGHVEIVTNVETTSQLKKTARVLEPASKSMTEIAMHLNSNSSDMNEQSSSAVSATVNLSANLTQVADASTEMSSSVGSVASAIEEMTSTVSEISKNCVSASSITNDAEIHAKDTKQTIDQLVESSKAIGAILGTIEEIAAQTNLLALNATIEAASAGEAGKGFAVVATEVKELAKQTASATEEISRQINDIQTATSQSSTAMTKITEVIGDINGITQTIASAIEEQSATVNELSQAVANASVSAESISENVNDASNRAVDVNSNIEELNRLAEATATEAATCNENAVNLEELSSNLTALTEVK